MRPARILHRPGPWLVKDPYLSFTGSLWMEAMRAPACVIVHRHPARTALALTQGRAASGPLAGLGPSDWLRVWEGSMMSALRTCRGRPTVLVQVRSTRQWVRRSAGMNWTLQTIALTSERKKDAICQQKPLPVPSALSACELDDCARPHQPPPPRHTPVPARQSTLTQPESLGLFYDTVLPALAKAGIAPLTRPSDGDLQQLYARHYKPRHPVTGVVLEPAAVVAPPEPDVAQQHQQQQQNGQQQREQQQQDGGGSSSDGSGGSGKGGNTAGRAGSAGAAARAAAPAAGAGERLVGGYEAVGKGVKRLVGGVEVDLLTMKCEYHEVSPEQLRNGALHGCVRGVGGGCRAPCGRALAACCLRLRAWGLPGAVPKAVKEAAAAAAAAAES
jgi:hypothetical protein